MPGDAVSAELLKFIRQGRSFSGHEPHCVFLNTHTPRFADISASSGLNLDDDGRAVGQVDWDQDGDLDVWIVNRNGPQLRFMRNALPSDHHFVALRLRGTTCNRDAIGARVEIIGAEGDSLRRVRSLRAGDGYLAQSEQMAALRTRRSGSHSAAGCLLAGRRPRRIPRSAGRPTLSLSNRARAAPKCGSLPALRSISWQPMPKPRRRRQKFKCFRCRTSPFRCCPTARLTVPHSRLSVRIGKTCPAESLGRLVSALFDGTGGDGGTPE